MLLAGFSQGGAMSLFTGLQLQLEIENEAAGAAPSLAGIMVMSAYLPGKISSVCCIACHCGLVLRRSKYRAVCSLPFNNINLPFLARRWQVQGHGGLPTRARAAPARRRRPRGENENVFCVWCFHFIKYLV